MTLDLSASNYALSATSITIGTRGILNGRGSTISCAGWDSSAGTFTQGTSSVHLTGTTKNLKTNGGMFNNLFIDSGASYTLQSNIKTYNYWKNGSLTLGGYTVTVNNDQAPVFTTTPSVTIFNWTSGYSYAAHASDREAETLTYGLATSLPNLTINTTTGLVSRAAPGNLVYGNFTMHISVMDGNATHTLWQNTTLTILKNENNGGSTRLQAHFEYLLTGNSLYFKDVSYGNETSRIWNFGDTIGSISSTGTHIYMKAGTYQITLIIYGANGETSEAQTTVRVGLGPSSMVLRNAQGTGWDVYLWPGATVQVSVFFLLFGSMLLMGTSVFIDAHRKSHPKFMSEKGKMVLATIMLLLALYIVFFFQNPYSITSLGG